MFVHHEGKARYPPAEPLAILLVDDEDTILSATWDCLTRCYAWMIDTARSVTEALDLIPHATYDTIIADYEMGEKNGLDLLSALRQNKDQTPSIIFTGGREEVLIQSFEHGADCYVQKGGEIRFQFADLAKTVASIVHQKRAEPALYEQKLRCRRLFATMDQGIIYLDRKGRILEEMKERLMEREVGPHTGYGLFLSKEILSITGMTVTETGEYGSGARFKFREPRGMFRYTSTDNQE